MNLMPAMPILMVLLVGAFYYPYQSNAMYIGPGCNEISLLGFPLVSPYFEKKIAFASNVGSTSPYDFTLYTVNSDGSGDLHRISTIPYPSTVAVSSDGTKIAFLKEVGMRAQVFVANTDGTGMTQLTSGNGTKSVIGITPDGRKIVYGIHYGGLGWIRNYYAIDSDGKNQIQITNDAMKKAWSALSFDGSTLVFNDDSRPPRIFAVRTDGSDLHYVTNGSLFSHSPVISANGLKIVFSREIDGGSYYKYYTINTDGTNLTLITNSSINPQADFTISLDGSRAVYGDMPLLSSDGSMLVYTAGNPAQTLYMSGAKGNGSLEIDSGIVGYEKEISPYTGEVVYPKISGKTEEILAATPGGKEFPLFDNSIFTPNPDCNVPYGGPIAVRSHTQPVPSSQWYDRVNGWVWVGAGVTGVTGFWFFLFRRFKE